MEQVISKNVMKEMFNKSQYPVLLNNNDDERLGQYLKTKKILKEFSPAKGVYFSADVLYFKSLSCSNKEDFQLYFDHIVNSYNAEFIYKFAKYHADDLTISQMRDIYSTLVETENRKYIKKFAEDVATRIPYVEEERYI